MNSFRWIHKIPLFLFAVFSPGDKCRIEQSAFSTDSKQKIQPPFVMRCARIRCIACICVKQQRGTLLVFKLQAALAVEEAKEEQEKVLGCDCYDFIKRAYIPAPYLARVNPRARAYLYSCGEILLFDQVK